MDVTNEKVFDASAELEELRAVQRCVELHDEWTAAARAAIECWIAVGFRLGVVKDIRLVIARLVWDTKVMRLVCCHARKKGRRGDACCQDGWRCSVMMCSLRCFFFCWMGIPTSWLQMQAVWDDEDTQRMAV